MTAPRARRPASASRIHIAADQRGLDRVFDAYNRFVRAHAVPDRVRHDVYVALEEIVSNVVRHGTRGRTPKISVKLAITRGAFHVDIVDDGPPFDPFAAAPPDISVPLLERPIGGLGILFVDRLTDGHTYNRRGNRNRVTLRRAIRGHAPATKAATKTRRREKN